MRAAGFLLGLAVILVVGMIAISNNQQEVTVIYFFGKSWTGKLWLALVAAFLGGLASASIFAGFFLVRGSVRLSLLSRKHSRLEEELRSLREKPLPEERPVFPSEPASPTPAGAHGKRG